MGFENIYNYPEVPLLSGLEIISKLPFLKLYSDGLENDEYFQYIPSRGICYEDGCIIGADTDCAITRLNECPVPWYKTAKFYLDIQVHFKPYNDYTLEQLQSIINDIFKNNEIGGSNIMHYPSHCIKFPNDIRGFEPGNLYIKQIKRRNKS